MMGVNSLPKTVTRQRRGCDLNPGPSAPESSTLATRLLSYRARVGITRSGLVAVRDERSPIDADLQQQAIGYRH